MNFSNRTYNILKNLAQIWLPAAGTLYTGLAVIWGLPAAEQVGGTVLAVDTFLGIVLGISTATYMKDPSRLAGTIELVPNEDGTALKMQSVKPNAFTGDEVTFKLVHPPQ